MSVKILLVRVGRGEEGNKEYEGEEESEKKRRELKC